MIFHSHKGDLRHKILEQIHKRKRERQREIEK
jgi:hypothetical protein